MRDITATMQLALDAIDQAPGTPASKLPGGTQTVIALMRRGAAEVQGEDWRVFKPQHQHAFRSTMHMDGCHFYRTDYVCECGVQATSIRERSMTDPYSIVWMEPTGKDECARCDELIAGARPKTEVIVGRPTNYQPDLKVVA